MRWSLESAQDQIEDFFDALSDKYKFTNGQPLFDQLEGLLMVGKDVLLVTLPAPGAAIKYSPVHGITSVAVHNFIGEVAVANWLRVRSLRRSRSFNSTFQPEK